MRDSRINHPPGARFVMSYIWAAQALGKDAAAVLGLFDFLDRASDKKGTFVASRARVLSDLEGIVTRYAVDNSLSFLTERGFLVKREREEIRKKNMTKTHEYALDADAVNSFLEKQNPDVLDSEPRRSESGTGDQSRPPVRNPGPVAGPESGTPSKQKEVDSKLKNNEIFSEAFSRFMQLYPPSRIGKVSKAIEVWNAISPSPNDDKDVESAIITGLTAWIRSTDWKKDGGKWIVSMERFLAERRWTNSPPSASHLGLNDDEKWKGSSALIGKRVGDLLNKKVVA